MQQVVITGINGFVGKHLTRELKSAGHKVIGLDRSETVHEEIADLVDDYRTADLAAGWPELPDVDAIIHLAGLAAVAPSFDNPQAYININSAIVTNMCEYYLKQERKPRILIISSGTVYDPSLPMPLHEEDGLAYTSPYVVSKALLEAQAHYYNIRGIECAIMRPFNHVGPGQMPGFLVPDLAERIRARESMSGPIEVGNLDTKRDYTDVRDVVKAYRLVATKEGKLDHPIYNVCSGVSHSGHEVLNAIVNAMGIEKPEAVVNEKFLRPNDIMDIRGDNSHLVNEFNWKLTYNFEQTIADFVNG